jgi:hypothetical protein
MHYRRRKKKIKIIIITALCAVAACTLLFVIVGNVLGKKVALRIENQAKNEDVTPPPAQHVTVKDVNAVSVALSASGSTLDGRVSNAVKNGSHDICFDIDSDNGSLLYASEAASLLGKQPDSAGLRTPDNIVGIFKDKGAYSIAVTDVPELVSENDLVRSAAIGYYSAICSELLRAGIDEVLICAKGLSYDQYGELMGLANEVHRLSPNMGKIGVSLPVGLLASAENDELIASLWSAFDYLAVDLCSDDTAETDTAERIEAELGSVLYHLLRYNIRALVPSVSDTELAARINEAVFSSGAKSIQRMP